MDSGKAGSTMEARPRDSNIQKFKLVASNVLSFHFFLGWWHNYVLWWVEATNSSMVSLVEVPTKCFPAIILVVSGARGFYLKGASALLHIRSHCCILFASVCGIWSQILQCCMPVYYVHCVRTTFIVFIYIYNIVMSQCFILDSEN